jgi:IclR family transcriptional regulator, KDG regulon repressor
VAAVRKRTVPPKPEASRRAEVKDATRSAGLRRGLQILCLFSEARPEWGVSEIAREMKVHKSRIHRSLKTLEDMGFLRKTPETRRYLMGFKTFEIGSLAGRLTNRMAWARHDLRQLARRLKATVSLRLVVDDDLLVVDMIESLDHLPAHMPQGARVPLNYGAGGQVLAAFLSDNAIRALIRKHGLPRYTAKSLTQEADFMDAVRRVRREGYAVSDGETIPGSFSVAAPIVAPDGILAAVLVVSRPLNDLSRSEIKAFAATTVETANQLSRRLIEAA